jgi:hypothetical protein
MNLYQHFQVVAMFILYILCPHTKAKTETISNYIHLEHQYSMHVIFLDFVPFYLSIGDEALKNSYEFSFILWRLLISLLASTVSGHP